MIHNVGHHFGIGDNIQIIFLPHNRWNMPGKQLIEFIKLALQFVEMLRFSILFPSALRVRLPLFDEL